MTVIGWELMFICSDPFHDFMLTFTRAVGPCKNDTDIFPVIVFFNLFLDEKVDHFIQFLHELCTWGNWIVFEVLLTVGTLLVVSVESFDELFVVSGAFESSGSLIVHFWSWSDTVQGEEDHFIRFEKIDNGVNVVEHFNPNLFELFRHDLCFEDNGVILGLMKLIPWHICRWYHSYRDKGSRFRVGIVFLPCAWWGGIVWWAWDKEKGYHE